MPLAARGPEEWARCLVHVGNAATPDLPCDGIVVWFCRRRGPVQAFLDAPLRDVDAAGLLEESLYLAPGKTQRREESHRGSDPGTKSSLGFLWNPSPEMSAAVVACKVPDEVVPYHAFHQQIEHLVERVVVAPGEFVPMAVGALVGGDIYDFVWRVYFLACPGMAGLSGLRLPAGHFPGGEASDEFPSFFLMLVTGLSSLQVPKAEWMLSSRRRPRIMIGLDVTDEGQLEFPDVV